MNDQSFKFLMLSAMYENGGNTTHRFLDGHPELFVYPFESQPGTKYVNDYLSSMFPPKYRWPVFPSHFTAEQAYYAIIDEECKVRARTPYVSKFRTAEFDFDDENRKAIFVDLLSGRDLSRANLMEAFFRATFMAWKNHKSTGQEKCWVGYSPIIGVDGDKIIEDYNGSGFVLHVVRNPFSCFAETTRRPVPLALEHYIMAWLICQYQAKYFASKYPDNFFILRYEDIILDPQKVLGEVLEKMGLQSSPSLSYTSWNAAELTEIYPWGTIRKASEQTNLETAQLLTEAQIAEIYQRTLVYLLDFEYTDFYLKLIK
jgi:hypothetical protein